MKRTSILLAAMLIALFMVPAAPAFAHEHHGRHGHCGHGRHTTVVTSYGAVYSAPHRVTYRVWVSGYWTTTYVYRTVWNPDCHSYVNARVPQRTYVPGYWKTVTRWAH